MNKKPIIMLHYSGFGIERSPNTQFDILRKQKILTDKYSFITLNQTEEPRKHGHIKTIIELTREIRRVKPYAVHIIGVKEGFHCTVAAWLAGCNRRILVTHGFAGVSKKNSLVRRVLFQRIIEPITLILSTTVQCNSEFSYHQGVIRRFARNKRCVIYNFLTITEEMLSQNKNWRLQHHIDDNDFLIATIGNMHVGKGYDILTKVIIETADEQRLKYVVIGDGVLRNEFEEQNKKMISSEKLICTGSLSHTEAMEILSQSDLFYLPTRFETLGMVFAEAGFCSIPSIGTRTGAVPEIIENGLTGYLIQQDSVDEAVNHIMELAQDSMLCERYGHAANVKIETMFSQDKIALSIGNLYES
jgi:glycosyltransferase involved in cell wall biosynthesis